MSEREGGRRINQGIGNLSGQFALVPRLLQGARGGAEFGVTAATGG